MAVPVQRVVHVNVNCSDLESSLRFYRERIGLEALSHTRPLPQDGSGFGLEGEVRWDAHLLHDHRGLEGPAVDLLEWKAPRPVGRPAAEANHLGFFRLCFGVSDVDAVHAEMRAAGIPCVSAPARVPIDLERGLEVRFFCCRDPDGATLEFIEQPGMRNQLLHVNVNCSDLARSSAWYQRVLGLQVLGHSEPGPVSGEGLGFAGPAEWRADFLCVSAESPGFVIDLLEWKQPRPVGRPTAEANHLGLFRMAFLVEDAHACWEELRREGVTCPPPVWLDMGPEIPVEGVWAVFFRDPDGACLELIGLPTAGGGSGQR